MSDVIVFDLDDTLYPEADYVLSGVRAVAKIIADQHGHALGDELLAAARAGDDWLALACELSELPPSAKESLLWAYRLHEPDIALTERAAQAIATLKDEGRVMAIITDGRSVTQRLKINALGISDIPAYISEEYGAAKPDPSRFEVVMEEWPDRSYAYIGDNPAKDFIAPKALGWTTIGVRRANSLYADADAPDDAQPHHWVGSVNEALPLL
ncbi:MAG: HAD family hydrolase [Sphingomonas sp.]|nr:HAD family hydrolase [Sphingomonas sp.]RZV48939.1 MAG: HAD family hydrolase [Sphingomonadaceae bacterium]